ncbi:MAG: hydrolase [Streptosporangiales bacterium]|nr:hydrolase [Streptosporangiales bacterium]
MTNLPFGFNQPEDPDESGRGGEQNNPFAAFGASNPQELSHLLHRFADLMSWQGGPVNWDLAKDVARHAITREADPTVTDVERRQVEEALRLADLWLDEVTTLPSGVTTPEAWSRAEWIERTLPVWSQLCDPIAARVVESMGTVLPQEMQGVAGPLFTVVRQMGGMMVGGQAGQALGALAQEVVGSTDVGLPLTPAGNAALLPKGVAAFGEGLGVPDDQVRLYLALREAAHHRLFTHAPWLRARLLGAVEEYARGITIDMGRLEDAVSHIDPSDPEALQNALQGEALFQSEETPEQRAALTRLETLLALVEGWVDAVVDAAARDRLPGAAPLAEAVRRRRAEGGPAERTFAALVGLELRPRRLREAGALWRALGDERGAEGRDAVWGHPDFMPTGEDLDHPEEFARRRGGDLDISSLESPDDKDTGAKDPDEDEPGG